MKKRKKIYLTSCSRDILLSMHMCQAGNRVCTCENYVKHDFPELHGAIFLLRDVDIKFHKRKLKKLI